ncbi:hypothetical protein [Pseudomonas aeruginosa]|uniref:hypothetical protein n=1 Tax=Pseudomonas aeruginosa TaxID=287 RepID=UPI001E613C6D|nr:hypothetical protein [Pseudomonas aeruginosa]
MSSTQHQLIEQCATRLRGIVEALDNIHDNTPHRWSADLDDVHSSAESLLAMIKDQAPAQAAQDLALRTIAEYPCPEQDNMTAANMRQVAADAITGALAFGAQASQPPAEDHWLRPFYDIGRAEGQRTQELAMLVRMLASSLKRHAPESNLVARATNYLAAKGLAGTPLRDPPAPVEQAGRDVEPAPCPFCGGEVDPTGWLRGDGTRGPECNYCGATARSMEAWQTRAALAQPSPKREQRLVECDACPTSGGCVEKCMKAPTQPSPAQAEQAEAERPEMSPERAAYFMRRFKSEEKLLGPNEQAAVDYVLSLLAQHDRIVGELRADRDSWAEQAEQRLADWDEMRKERDAALARVEQQERTIAGMNEAHAKLAGLYEAAQAQHSVPDGAADLCRFLAKLYCELDGLRYSTAKLPAEQIADALIFKWPVLQGARNQLNIKRISEQPYDESKLHSAIVAMLAAAPGNSAQHSVPEGWKLVPIEPLLNMMSDKDHDTRITAERQLLSILADAPGNLVPQAWLDVQAERRRQVEAEGWTPEHDDEHADGQMAQAAGCYALHAGGIGTDWPDGRQNGAALFWPWDKDSWKPTTPRRDLVKACALALAEIERLDRAGISQSPQPGATTASS